MNIKQYSNLEILRELFERMKVNDEFLFSVIVEEEKVITVLAVKNEKKGIRLDFRKNGEVKFDFIEFELNFKK